MKKPNSEYQNKIDEAIRHMENHQFDKAVTLIHEAMSINDNGVEAQNLLGAYYELTGDRLLALRHYRAAYAMEPSYQYANLNIERLTCDFLDEANRTPFLGHEDLKKTDEIDAILRMLR